MLDYYGRKLATCSSDRTIKIFEIDGESQRHLDTLKGQVRLCIGLCGCPPSPLCPPPMADTLSTSPPLHLSRHDGAVWSVAWAHPKYGNILASAGYDGKVFVWKEQAGAWQRVYDFALHRASVNSVAWAPHESGCLLACASSDGQVSVLEFKDNTLDHKIFLAHGLGVNAVSWAPATAAGNIVSSSSPGPAAAGAATRRFVTGGCDNLVRLWTYDSAAQTYREEAEPLAGHSDWVRDVAWSPTILHKSYIASASQDQTVRIWTSEATSAGPWASHVLKFEAPVWRVSWSLSGNVLAVSGGDNAVTLWKENLRGEWECVKTMTE